MSYAAFTKRMAADAGRIHWRPEHYPTLAKVYKISEEQVAKAVTPAPVVSSFPEAVTKAAPADVQRSFRWTMNDGEIDRAGDIVMASGVDTSHFKSNPIALLGHDPTKYIGTWSGVHADGGKLKGTLNLAPTRLGEHVRENIAAGVLKAASIGFVPIEFEPITKGGFQFNKIELMETSIVSIPASRGSLRERELTPEQRRAERQEALEVILVEQRHLDAEAAAKERRKRKNVELATRQRAEAKAKSEWDARCKRTTPEERREDRLRNLERLIGGDDGARAAQRIRDSRR